LFVQKRIMSAVKRVEFVSNMMMNVIVSSQWCDISVLSVKAPTANSSGNIRTVSLRTQSGKLLNSMFTTVLENSNAKIGTEDIFKQCQM
jgi:2-phospho-L-lactate guanylyltransferase (CobY/MobA/RfbA family)